MSSQQKDHKPYLPGYKEVGHHAHRTVANSIPYLIPTLHSLSSQKENQNLSLLDVGAGPGTITADLALNYLPPAARITAIDLSPEIIARASSHAEKVGAAQNITFKAPVSVYDLSSTFGENAFDVVHTHQMLTHLDAPVDALREMLAVLKPGGILAAREVDMRMWSIYPDTGTMNDWLRVQLAVHEAAGASKMAGPSLVSWAMQAGCQRGDIEASMGTLMYSTEEERRVWGTSFRDRILGGEMRKKALELGIATEAEMDEMGAEWQRWMETEDATCGTLHGEIIVRKPL